MNGKNILITGGNAGIGLATAIALAKQGANIYIVSRSSDKAEQAVKQIIEQSGNNHIQYFTANLSSQKSIRQLVQQIKAQLSVIDVLINNAEGVFPEYQLNEDGLEMTIATNHFSYFLLTNLLLDLIKKSDYARIINVASDSHYSGKIDFDSFCTKKPYRISKAYAQSKLANVLFTNKLAAMLSNSHITVNSLHPGVVKTNIGNKNVQWYASLAWSLFSGWRGVTVEEGAQTSVYLASSAQVKGVSGKYFDKCREKKPSSLALNPDLQNKLWSFSLEKCPIN